MMEENKTYPEGYFIGRWTGIGIALFSGLGVPISIALDNFAFIGIGPGIGIAFGAAIGASIEAKHRKEGRIRELTLKEKKGRRGVLISGIILAVLGLAVLIALWLLK